MYIGTSGWNYDSWRDFYGDTPKRRRLEHYAAHFHALEVNASHYRLQSPDTYRDWRDRVPADFRFAVKVHRFLTHNKKLGGIEAHIATSRDRARALGKKLAVMLWQLPVALHANAERLDRFARLLSRRWTSARHAVELRHPSWFTDEIAEVMSRAELAVVISDAPDFPMWERVTTDLVYVRLHGHTRKYASRYAAESLRRWAERARGWRDEGRDVHVYFDNDAEGHAPHDALELIALVSA